MTEAVAQMWSTKMRFLKNLQNSQQKAVPESLMLANLLCWGLVAFKPVAYKKCKTKDSSGKTEWKYISSHRRSSIKKVFSKKLQNLIGYRPQTTLIKKTLAYLLFVFLRILRNFQEHIFIDYPQATASENTSNNPKK